MCVCVCCRAKKAVKDREKAEKKRKRDEEKAAKEKEKAAKKLEKERKVGREALCGCVGSGGRSHK